MFGPTNENSSNYYEKQCLLSETTQCGGLRKTGHHFHLPQLSFTHEFFFFSHMNFLSNKKVPILLAHNLFHTIIHTGFRLESMVKPLLKDLFSFITKLFTSGNSRMY